MRFQELGPASQGAGKSQLLQMSLCAGILSKGESIEYGRASELVDEPQGCGLAKDSWLLVIRGIRWGVNGPDFEFILRPDCTQSTVLGQDADIIKFCQFCSHTTI